jgi:hypothetical protein
VPVTPSRNVEGQHRVLAGRALAVLSQGVRATAVQGARRGWYAPAARPVRLQLGADRVERRRLHLLLGRRQQHRRSGRAPRPGGWRPE